MTDKVQKIRKEVQKIARSINPYIPDEEGKNSEYEAGRFAMVTQIMQIIDSLQEEPVSEDLKEAANAYAVTVYNNYLDNPKTFVENTDADTLNEDAFKAGAKWQKTKDSIVSEDFEKASKEWLTPQLDKSYVNYGEVKMMELTHFDGYAMLDAIEFGAKWQKAKDESITEDLGEYISKLSKQFPEVSFAKLSRIAVRVAKWQKEQIKRAMDLGEPPYLISVEQAYYRTLKLLEERL